MKREDKDLLVFAGVVALMSVLFVFVIGLDTGFERMGIVP